MVCEQCGSEDVGIDAYAEWSVEEQEWVLASTYDAAWCTPVCRVCDGETTLVEKNKYYVGQPVTWVKRDSYGYTQEFGPNEGKPVVHGILTDDGENLHVWWEYCSEAYSCIEDQIKPREEK